MDFRARPAPGTPDRDPSDNCRGSRPVPLTLLARDSRGVAIPKPGGHVLGYAPSSHEAHTTNPPGTLPYPMHTQFLAGVVFAWVVSYIGIGLSFCIAYSIHKREPEHLLFGLHSLALAVYSTGLTLGYTYVSELDARFAVRIAVGGDFGVRPHRPLCASVCSGTGRAALRASGSCLRARPRSRECLWASPQGRAAARQHRAARPHHGAPFERAPHSARRLARSGRDRGRGDDPRLDRAGHARRPPAMGSCRSSAPVA